MLLYPVAVRAPAGHCKREPTEVVLTDALMSRPLSVNTMLQLPDCFHVTQRCNLGNIRMEGLVPGGNGIQSRMLTFFNPYAPSDYMEDHQERRHSVGWIHRAVYPNRNFVHDVQRKVDRLWTVVTEHVIPFSFIRGGWYQDSQIKTRWVRLMVPSGPEKAIRTAIMPSHIASKESVLRIAHACFASHSEKGTMRKSRSKGLSSTFRTAPSPQAESSNMMQDAVSSNTYY